MAVVPDPDSLSDVAAMSRLTLASTSSSTTVSKSRPLTNDVALAVIVAVDVPSLAVVSMMVMGKETDASF